MRRSSETGADGRSVSFGAVNIPSSLTVPASINRGVPIVVDDPKGPVSVAIQTMTDEHVRRRLGEDLPQQSHRKGLFSRSSR